jgi:GH24 family phage-related lysozyme (muramidase)
MTRPIPTCLKPFLTKAETPVMRVYDDKRPKRALKVGYTLLGTLTAGIGHTGADVVIGLKVTPAMVDRWLDMDIATAAMRLYNVVKPDVIDSLTDNQYAAMISFVFNLGTEPTWTIWKVLNARQYDQVPAQFARFVYSDGKKMDGLVNRRNAEIALWSTAEPGSVANTPPSSVTREADTPPAPPPPKPLDKASMAVKVTTAVTAVGAGASQVKDIVAPHMTVSPIFAKVVAVLTGVIIVCAVLALWIHHEQAKRAAS